MTSAVLWSARRERAAAWRGAAGVRRVGWEEGDGSVPLRAQMFRALPCGAEAKRRFGFPNERA
jgi:hypothetical protein